MVTRTIMINAPTFHDVLETERPRIIGCVTLNPYRDSLFCYHTPLS